MPHMEAHPPRQPEIEAETATGKKRRTRLKSEGSVPGNAAYWREPPAGEAAVREGLILIGAAGGRARRMACTFAT